MTVSKFGVGALPLVLLLAGVLAGVLAPSVALAKVVTVKATGYAEYRGKVGKKDKREAQEDAMRAAVERWAASGNRSQYKNYEREKVAIDKSVEDYVLSTRQLVEENDEAAKRYSVTLSVELNEPRLTSTLMADYEAAGGDESYITFVFVARQQTRTREQTSGDTDQPDNGVRSATEIIWDVTTTNEVNVATGEVFTDYGLLVVDADLIEDETGGMLRVDDFVEDYRYGDDITGATRSSAVRGLKGLTDPVKFLAIGTLDVDMEKLDPVTGQRAVYVWVTGKIMDVERRGSVVAAVGPVQYKGLGPTSSVARNNALSLAAQEAAKALVDKLSNKNIR